MKPVLTQDGSFTLYHEKSGEHYHSIRGALTESNHVFIQAGLREVADEGRLIHIIEMGFGTGLNALLSLQFAQANRIKIHYTAIELYPLAPELITQLNIPNLANAPELSAAFEVMHQCDPDATVTITEFFTFIKCLRDIRQFHTDIPADVVYYDAFSPNVQPELWTIAVFENLYQMMRSEAVLVTYCAKGQVKRHLKSAGFSVTALPGAAGKREMIRAKKRG